MAAIELGLKPGGGRVRPVPAFDFAAGLPPGATLTRPSAGRYWRADGVLASAAADVPRFDHDPASGAPRGLLIEPAARNLLFWGGGIEQLREWSDCVVTGEVAGSPDGAANWGRIEPVPGPGRMPYVADGTVAKDAAETYTLSVYLGHATLRWALLRGDDPAGARHAWFDLATGTVGTTGAHLLAATITSAGPGRWRAAVTFTGTASETCLLAPVAADGITGGAYAAGDAMLAWGMMLETGARATSLVASAGEQGARAADRLRLEWRAAGVADGAATVRYTFDDGSYQDVATAIADGAAVVPTDLNRRWLRRAELI